MYRNKLCQECGAPRRLVREHRWLSNGTIVQRKNPHHRMVFIECENINATYRNIEDIIGHPVEDLLIEAKYNATFDFIDHLLPAGVKTVVKQAGARLIARSMTNLGCAMGYGRIKLYDVRRIHGRDDYVTFRVEDPYSLPLLCGDVAGSLKAIDRREVEVSYTRLSPGIFEITARISDRPLGTRERLEGRRYTYKAGDLEMERCPSCGGPLFLSGYEWDLKRGLVVSRNSGHRKAMIGPAGPEAVIELLQSELGDSVAEKVIEAQCRFVKTGFYSLEQATSEEGLRAHLALRGLGNLREMRWEGDRLSLRLENSCMHLFLVGLVKGIYELATGKDAEMAWEMDGKLGFKIDARPAG